MSKTRLSNYPFLKNGRPYVLLPRFCWEFGNSMSQMSNSANTRQHSTKLSNELFSSQLWFLSNTVKLSISKNLISNLVSKKVLRKERPKCQKLPLPLKIVKLSIFKLSFSRKGQTLRHKDVKKAFSIRLSFLPITMKLFLNCHSWILWSYLILMYLSL